MSKNRFSNIQTPIKLSLIVASFITSGCSQLDQENIGNFQNILANGGAVISEKTAVSLADRIDGVNAEDPKTILIEAAKMATEKNEYGQALIYWDELTKNYPDYAAGYLGYSSVGRKVNAHQKVLAKLYDYKAEHADDYLIMSEIAKVYYDQKKYKMALEEIDVALTFEKDDWKIYSLRGVISDKLNYFTEARASYDKALALSPENPVVLNNMAASMIHSDELGEAEFYAIKAMEAPSVNDQVYRTYAKILTLRGQTDQAREVLMKKIDDEDKVSRILSSVNANIAKPVLWGRR